METSPRNGDGEDIVAFMLALVAERLRVPVASLADIDAEVRRDWGGDRPYIAKVGENGRLKRSQREARIRSEFQQGEHVSLLSRRHGLSARRIQQILKSSDTRNGLS